MLAYFHTTLGWGELLKRTVASAIALIYYFAPDVDQDFVFLTPGSLVATLLWLVGSLAFRYYIDSYGSYNETYGAIGSVIVVLLWLYITGLVIIVGAEMNAAIEHASPHGKAAGEKRPGERTMIGVRAARAFLVKHGRLSGSQEATDQMGSRPETLAGGAATILHNQDRVAERPAFS